MFGNRLKSLPKDLSKLQKLKKIDLNNNFFGSIDDLLLSLKTIPNLIDLQYTLQNSEDEEKVLVNLPKLMRFNSKEIFLNTKQKISPVDVNCDYAENDFSLKQEELEKVALIYDDLRSL